MNNEAILPEQLPRFISEFAKATVNSLYDRFPDSEILNALRIFDPHELPPHYNQVHLYGQHEIQILSDFYGVSKQLQNVEHPAIINSEMLTNEWNVFKYRLLQYRSVSTSHTWKILLDLPNFSTQFPNISKLACIFLTTPLSNAVVERIFSQQNLIKTRIRNRIQPSTLQMLLMIAINGPDSEIFDWEKAYQF
jgi:hypothetical protein